MRSASAPAILPQPSQTPPSAGDAAIPSSLQRSLPPQRSRKAPPMLTRELHASRHPRRLSHAELLAPAQPRPSPPRLHRLPASRQSSLPTPLLYVPSSTSPQK